MKVIQFCKECVGELKKVVWPTRGEVFSSVKVVVISTLICAAILGLLDWLFFTGFNALMK